MIGAGTHGPGVRHRRPARRLLVWSRRQGLPVQLALPLPGEHDLLHHAGAAGDRRHAVLQPKPEAEPHRGARVLPQGRRALQAERAPVPDRRRRARSDGDFQRDTTDRFERSRDLGRASSSSPPATTICPTTLGIPGEDLPKVTALLRRAPSLLRAARPRHRRQELGRHRRARPVAARRESHPGPSRPELHRHVKYWILPDIDNRIKNGEITALLPVTVDGHRRGHRDPADPRRRKVSRE